MLHKLLTLPTLHGCQNGGCVFAKDKKRIYGDAGKVFSLCSKIILSYPEGFFNTKNKTIDDPSSTETQTFRSPFPQVEMFGQVVFPASHPCSSARIPSNVPARAWVVRRMTETKKKNRASVGRSVLFGSGSCLSAGADCERSSQGRPFFAFPTIHRMVGIAFGDRLRTHFVAAGDSVRIGKYQRLKQNSHLLVAVLF